MDPKRTGFTYSIYMNNWS